MAYVVDQGLFEGNVISSTVKSNGKIEIAQHKDKQGPVTAHKMLSASSYKMRKWAQNVS